MMERSTAPDKEMKREQSTNIHLGRKGGQCTCHHMGGQGVQGVHEVIREYKEVAILMRRGYRGIQKDGKRAHVLVWEGREYR